MFVVLAIVAIIYLLVGALGVSEILPNPLSIVLRRFAVTIIATSIPLFLYDLSGAGIFGGIAIAMFSAGLFVTFQYLILGRAKRAYRRRFGGQVPKDEWVCRKCGELNKKIDRTCARCRGLDPAKEPAPDNSWICNNCGKKNFLNDKNCTTCGNFKNDKRYSIT